MPSEKNIPPPERIWFLIARRLAGESSVDKLAELQALLKESPAHAYFLEVMSRRRGHLPETDADGIQDSQVIIDKARRNESPLHKPRHGQRNSLWALLITALFILA